MGMCDGRANFTMAISYARKMFMKFTTGVNLIKLFTTVIE